MQKITSQVASNDHDKSNINTFSIMNNSTNYSVISPAFMGDFHNTVPAIGDKIEDFQPLENQSYPGLVLSISNDGKYIFEYCDGVVETILMEDELWGNQAEHLDDVTDSPISEISTKLLTNSNSNTI